MDTTILTLPEISGRTRVPLATLRWYRAKGSDGPKLWKLGGRIVAYEADVQAWIDQQYQAEQVTT